MAVVRISAKTPLFLLPIAPNAPAAVKLPSSWTAVHPQAELFLMCPPTGPVGRWAPPD